MKKIIAFSLIASVVLMALSACNKQLDALSPHNVNFEAQQFSSPNGYTKATVGNYAQLGSAYETNLFNLSEFRGNNVRFIDIPSTNANTALQHMDAFTYTNSEIKDFGLSNSFWFASYQALLGINQVLKNVPAAETNSEILQAKAENLFLRAFINFNLVRLYGRPYYQSAATNPGIPLILTPLDLAATPPSRATVQETYDQIIKDLKQSATFFRVNKANSFASKAAAYALLSRVYLYMSGPFTQPNRDYASLSIQYADSVIQNSSYKLLQGSAYANYFKSSNINNTETIWAYNHDVTLTSLPILLMQPQGTYVGLYSTGQVKPSPDLLAQITPTDLRMQHYYTDPYPNNTTDLLSTGKYLYLYFNGVNAVNTSRAAVNYIRLAEVYLNRAEAKVKLGNNEGALADVNVIHQRAGLTALIGLSGQALFDAVLNERRIELAFEGHNSYDYFRNGLPMVRNYSSFKSPAFTINPTDPKVVLRISLDVLTENPNIKQNAQ